MRDGAKQQGRRPTPKNGTNAASRVPKSMSGRLKKASPRRIARTRARPASSRAKILGVAEAEAPRRAPCRSPDSTGAGRSRRPSSSGTAIPTRRRRRVPCVRREPHHGLRCARRDGRRLRRGSGGAAARRRRVPEEAAPREGCGRASGSALGKTACASRPQRGRSRARGCAAATCGAIRRGASRASRSGAEHRLGAERAARATATERPTGSAPPPSCPPGSAAACGPHANTSIRPRRLSRCGTAAPSNALSTPGNARYPIIRESPSY